MTSNALDLKGGVKDSWAINKGLQLLRRSASGGGGSKGCLGSEYLIHRLLIYGTGAWSRHWKCFWDGKWTAITFFLEEYISSSEVVVLVHTHTHTNRGTLLHTHRTHRYTHTHIIHAGTFTHTDIITHIIHTCTHTWHTGTFTHTEAQPHTDTHRHVHTDRHNHTHRHIHTHRHNHTHIMYTWAHLHTHDTGTFTHARAHTHTGTLAHTCMHITHTHTHRKSLPRVSLKVSVACDLFVRFLL